MGKRSVQMKYDVVYTHTHIHPTVKNISSKYTITRLAVDSLKATTPFLIHTNQLTDSYAKSSEMGDRKKNRFLFVCF